MVLVFFISFKSKYVIKKPLNTKKKETAKEPLRKNEYASKWVKPFLARIVSP